MKSDAFSCVSKQLFMSIMFNSSNNVFLCRNFLKLFSKVFIGTNCRPNNNLSAFILEKDIYDHIIGTIC